MSTVAIDPRRKLERWGDMEMDLNSSYTERLNRSPEPVHLAEIFSHGGNNILDYMDEELRTGKIMQRTVIDGIVEPQDNQNSQELHCSCQTLYDETKFYIQCDQCSIWYHGECEDVTSEQADLIDIYACKACCSK
ncbi:unnamed protein product [Diamesa tonsa]